jgi:hypothetical protein
MTETRGEASDHGVSERALSAEDLRQRRVIDAKEASERSE